MSSVVVPINSTGANPQCYKETIHVTEEMSIVPPSWMDSELLASDAYAQVIAEIVQLYTNTVMLKCRNQFRLVYTCSAIFVLVTAISIFVMPGPPYFPVVIYAIFMYSANGFFPATMTEFGKAVNECFEAMNRKTLDAGITWTFGPNPNYRKRGLRYRWSDTLLCTMVTVSWNGRHPTTVPMTVVVATPPKPLLDNLPTTSGPPELSATTTPIVIATAVAVTDEDSFGETPIATAVLLPSS